MQTIEDEDHKLCALGELMLFIMELLWIFKCKPAVCCRTAAMDAADRTLASFLALPSAWAWLK